MYSIMDISPDNQVQHAILPFDINDSNNHSHPTSLQFEQLSGLNIAYGSLSSLYDDTLKS